LTIPTAGARLHARTSGSGAPTLVFLHYWGGSHRTWRGVTDRLDHDIRCVAIDQRGWGESSVDDGRYGLAAMADDVEAVAERLQLDRCVLVGHSMGGKVAQIVAMRRAAWLAGLVLVAPAPPTPIQAPAEQREAMLISYQSREGALQALSVLAGSPLSAELREQVVADTLRGAPEAKRDWTETGMLLDISAAQQPVALPLNVVVGSLDVVEREAVLRDKLPPLFPQAVFKILSGIGHLSPLEAPAAIAEVCRDLVRRL
jgi:pimeloyl-ACP methyl ester carboxylesterase